MAFIDLPKGNITYDLAVLLNDEPLPVVLWCNPRWCEQLIEAGGGVMVFKPDENIPEFLDGFIPIYSSQGVL